MDRLGGILVLLLFVPETGPSGWRAGAGTIDPGRAVESAKLLYDPKRRDRGFGLGGSPGGGGITSLLAGPAELEIPSFDALLAGKLPLLLGSVGLDDAAPPVASCGAEGGNAVAVITCELP